MTVEADVAAIIIMLWMEKAVVVAEYEAGINDDFVVELVMMILQW